MSEIKTYNKIVIIKIGKNCQKERYKNENQKTI